MFTDSDNTTAPVEGLSSFKSKDDLTPLMAKDLRKLILFSSEENFNYLSLSFADKNGFDSCLSCKGIIRKEDKIILLIDSWPLKGSKEFGLQISNDFEILFCDYKSSKRMANDERREKIKEIILSLSDTETLWIGQIHHKKEIKNITIAPVTSIGPEGWYNFGTKITSYNYGCISVDAYFSFYEKKKKASPPAAAHKKE